jgi:V8-like Glu-specific endopeptidase
VKTYLVRIVCLLAIVALLGLAPAGGAAGSGQACQAGAEQLAKKEVGKVKPFQAESPDAAPDGWSQVYTFPGATFLRLHFQNFKLEQGDKLVVSSLDGAEAWEYTGEGVNGDGDFWSFATNGESVKVELVAPSGRSHKVKIVEVGIGTVGLDKVKNEPTPEVVCGTDGREDIACRTSDAVVNNTQKSVARLLFTSGGSQYVCTGELVRGSNANTLITNAHCMDTQKEVASLQALFNYQYTACRGSTLATTSSYAGGTMLKTNAEAYNKRKASTGLDYTLLTLQGNPEATWGELIPTTASYSVGTPINFIQHPGGQPKEIGYWEDAEQTVRCKVDTISKTYGKSKPNSQIGYGCDSEGGSSGSSITRASDGKIIGLHHYGGVSTSPCLNSASMMSLICQDAGGLLLCDGN